jgi:hypothetical protein
MIYTGEGRAPLRGGLFDVREPRQVASPRALNANKVHERKASRTFARMEETTMTYMVCDETGGGHTLRDGLQEHEARHIAQRIANRRAESVWLSESDSEDMGEEIEPTTNDGELYLPPVHDGETLPPVHVMTRRLRGYASRAFRWALFAGLIAILSPIAGMGLANAGLLGQGPGGMCPFCGTPPLLLLIGSLSFLLMFPVCFILFWSAVAWLVLTFMLAITRPEEHGQRETFTPAR